MNSSKVDIIGIGSDVIMNEFTRCVIDVIKEIPYGEVMSYGEIAHICGNSKASRQVVRVLHAFSEKENLPWHRVVRSDMQIAESPFSEEQKAKLIEEGLIIKDRRISIKKT